jgi:protein phosphatase
MIVAARTHAGWVRPNNQDTLLLAGRLYGVADGMGGHNGGEVASNGAAAVIGDMLSGLEPNEKRLESGIQAANRRLYEQQSQDAALSGMGTTVTVLWEGNDEVFIGHVGDSRAYLLRDGVFSQVTQDHSVVAEMMRQGILTKEKAKKHPYRNVITRAVGTSSGIEVDVIRQVKKPGDIWLICSDGLYGMVEESDIENAMKTHSLEDAAEHLLKLALDNGGRDNVSLVLLKVSEVAQ